MKKILIGPKITLALGLVGLLGIPDARAADRTFVVVTNAQVLNHWPGADGFVGTPDDVVSSELSKFARSTPNSYGTYSLIVTSLGFSNEPDPFLPTGNDTATFVRGSVTIDPGANQELPVPALKALEFSGTDLFPGHGAYTVRVTNRRSGAPSRQGNTITFSTRFDFEGEFAAGPARATNALADGQVLLVDAKDYNAPDFSAAPSNLAAYCNSVALPLAKSAGASALLCGKMKLITSGSVPGTSGSFPPLNTDAVVVAFEFAAAAQFRISAIEATPGGVRLIWSPLPGKRYAVEASSALGLPFNEVTRDLTGTEYLDAAAIFEFTRYYRIRAE